MLFASMPLAMWIIGFIYGFIILWMYGSVLTQNEGNLWLGILGGALSAVIMWATGFWFVIMSAINLPVAPSTWAISCLMIVIVMEVFCCRMSKSRNVVL